MHNQHTHTHRYYGDIITRKKERNVSVDDIEVTCTSLQKGDRVRALWKLSDRKDYPGTVTKIVDKNHVSIHYDDDSNKKKCPLNWTMPLKRKSFDPAAVTFGQTVRWCSILLTRSRNTHFKHWISGTFTSSSFQQQARTSCMGSCQVSQRHKGTESAHKTECDRESDCSSLER